MANSTEPTWERRDEGEEDEDAKDIEEQVEADGNVRKRQDVEFKRSRETELRSERTDVEDVEVAKNYNDARLRQCGSWTEGREE